MNDCHSHKRSTRKNGGAPLDLQTVKAKLKDRRGLQYWRSLEELGESDEFIEMLHREFPREASVLDDGVERRSFLKFMGASLALAGMTAACSRQPDEHIIPFVQPPVELTPGTPLYFATAMPVYGHAVGILAENHMGRPTKVEGNKYHPASLGSTDAQVQASILSLYDPDRSAVALKTGAITTWENFTAFLDTLLNGPKDGLGAKIGPGLRDQGGAGLRILTGTVTSPTLGAQLIAFLNDLPGARWHQYEPVNRDNARGGARLAFGEPLNTVYQFQNADVVLSLDANFLSEGPGSIRYSRDFAAHRDPDGINGAMNRLYVVESTPTVTGAAADHAVHVRPSAVETIARAIARGLGLDAPGPEPDEKHKKFVSALVADLLAHKGTSLVLAGDAQPPIVHALAHGMNAALGNAGATVYYTEPVESNAEDQLESLRTLVRDMEDGKVDSLIVIDVNPVYDAPADLNFAAAMEKVNHRVHLGLYVDETAVYCHWHIPMAHFLESWGDCRAFDGTVSLIQPLIAPLYGGKTATELMAAMSGKGGLAYDILRAHWQQVKGSAGFETFWRESLAKGLIEGSAFAPKEVEARANVFSQPQQSSGPEQLEVAFRPDPTIGDGRWANNGWLQELPKPLTRITWDNAVIISFNLAQQRGLNNFDYVDVTIGDRSVRGQVWIQPGHPDGVITLHLGYGRERGGKVASGAGFNAYAVRTSNTLDYAVGAELSRVGAGPELARTELHQMLHQHDRPLARVGTLAEYREHPDFAQHVHGAHHNPEMDVLKQIKDHEYDGYKWGMVIDLNACTGCGACIVACQAENNIPVVGKDQVARGREMHWIRVDRYYKGDDPSAELEVVHQPVPCMQCENAPCEVVCPVGATLHSKEGLNDMVYNRCVGTRYCSNNCPYKVRRFNFFEYSDITTPSKQMMYNPDVTVRRRGVMEKCTYCVQRINLARIEAKKEGRKVRDGEVVTACQSACPAAAIVFGDQSDPESRVSRQKKDNPRNYALLAELNTHPRTTYLAKLRNPNPELEATDNHGSH